MLYRIAQIRRPTVNAYLVIRAQRAQIHSVQAEHYCYKQQGTGNRRTAEAKTDRPN
jgi:hypothetical protein